MASRTARIRRCLAGLGLLVAAAVAVAGCGAPHFTYIADSNANTYFKVPYGWQPVESGQLFTLLHGQAPSATTPWMVGYDAARAPNVLHALSSAVQRPFVYATVVPVKATVPGRVPTAALMDFITPVTAPGRALSAQQGVPMPQFRLLHTKLLSPGQGIRGVRVIFRYRSPSGHMDTWDKIVLINSAQTTVYVMLLHCESACYSRYRAQINTVMTSFTVRS